MVGFANCSSEIPLDAVATAHTLDDQAETVLAKFLRGAWTEGLSGIYPKLETPGNGCHHSPAPHHHPRRNRNLSPHLNQPWREDSSNRHLTFTRNRIRHELLPASGNLESAPPRTPRPDGHARPRRRSLVAGRTCPPRSATHSSRPSRPRRRPRCSRWPCHRHHAPCGASPALQRRLLRHAAAQLGAAPDFAATESLRNLALTGRAGQKLELAQGLRAERTHRELRLTPRSARPEPTSTKVPPEYILSIPGETDAPAFGLRLSIDVSTSAAPWPGRSAQNRPPSLLEARRPGAHPALVQPRKIKEVLERMKVTGSDRALWPVLEFDGHIVWMRGVELEPEPGDRRCR